MNKYLEKIAALTSPETSVAMVKEASNYIMKGLYSPAWQERSIAAEYGQSIPSTGGINGYGKGQARTMGRGLAEAIGLGFVGSGLGGVLGRRFGTKLLGKRVNKTLNKIGLNDPKVVGSGIGGTLGYLGGMGHGMVASLKNQAQEAHKHYSHQKQAAVAQLIDAGLDFDNAVALVANKSQELYGC